MQCGRNSGEIGLAAINDIAAPEDTQEPWDYSVETGRYKEVLQSGGFPREEDNADSTEALSFFWPQAA